MASTIKQLSLIVAAFTILSSISASAQQNSAPLMLGLKSGYSMPADGDMESTMVTGIEAQFAVSDERVFMIEYDYASKSDLSGTYTGNTSQSGTAISEFAVVSLMHFENGLEKPGLYYGAGLAYSTYRFSTIVTSATGAMFSVNSHPSRLGGILTLGYGGRKKFYIETRYLYAGKKEWNPLTNQKTDLGGFSLSAGYRLAIN